jgi:uncharacterized membrane protein
MLRIDECMTQAPVDVCYKVGADVERWPQILRHYRWVKFRHKEEFAKGVVEMAAWRPFGVLNYPTWWVSEMWHDAGVPAVFYRHIEGITRGMNVRWDFESRGDQTLIRVVHEWGGPSWPFIGAVAAQMVIGPFFISAIARRTLAGVAAEAQGAWSAS